METGANTPFSRLREPEFFPECWKTILKGEGKKNNFLIAQSLKIGFEKFNRCCGLC